MEKWSAASDGSLKEPVGAKDEPMVQVERNAESFGASPRLRMLVVGVSWPMETFLLRLFFGLADAGIEVTIASRKRPGEVWLSHPHCRWLPLPAESGPLPFRMVKMALLYARALPRLSRKSLRSFLLTSDLRPSGVRAFYKKLMLSLPLEGQAWDVLYFPWNETAIRYLPLFDRGAPVIVSCRGAHVNVAPHNPERAAIRDGLRKTFQRAAAVHCVSKAILAEATALGLDPVKARVITPAVDPDDFRPGALEEVKGSGRGDENLFRILTTGSLIWRKGYEYLLSTIRLLVDAGIPATLEIIGEGSERQRILYTVRDLGLEDRVFLRGRLPPEKVREHLQQADAFALSSLSEGISNAVLEAMACGTPVVTTDCGGMREAVCDGCEGFVTPTRDPMAMAAALESLWRSPSLRRQMGKAGRQTVVQRFSLHQQIDAFVALCESVVDRSRS